VKKEGMSVQEAGKLGGERVEENRGAEFSSKQ
jgi:hypothetical protein